MWGLIPVRGRFDRFAGSYEVGPGRDCNRVDGRRRQHRHGECEAGRASALARLLRRRRSVAGALPLDAHGRDAATGSCASRETSRSRASSSRLSSPPRCARGGKLRDRGDDDRPAATVRHEPRRARDDPGPRGRLHVKALLGDDARWTPRRSPTGEGERRGSERATPRLREVVLSDLVGELATQSEAFRAHWAAHDVRFHNTGVKQLHHPVVGDLSLSYNRLDLPGDNGLTIFTYTAEPGSRSEEALMLLGSWAPPDLAETARATDRAQARHDTSLPAMGRW